ncbi:MAG: 3D domain-containing protein [Kiritimatiellia bacterium]
MGRLRRILPAAAAVALALAVLGLSSCRPKPAAPPRSRPEAAADPSLVLVTGYCNCGTCCGWKRSWFGFGPPVYAAGSMKGRPKKVGVTANGRKAKHGTIAADLRVWKFGTRLDVPGYGVGEVEDVGGAIRGRHIDVWFPTHEEARRWGRRYLKVREVADEKAAPPAGKTP